MNAVEKARRNVWWPIVLLALVVGLVLYLVRGSLSPLVLSAIVAYLLNPLVDIGERHALPRWLTITLLYVVIGGLIVLAIFYLMPLLFDQLHEIQQRLKTLWPLLPGYLDAIVEWVNARIPAFRSFIEEPQLGSRIVNTAQEWLTRTLEHTPALLTKALSNLVVVLSYFVMVPFIAFFLLRDGRQFKRGLIALVPNRYFEATLSVIAGVGESVGRYLRGVLLESLTLGLMATIGLLIIGLKAAIVVGFVAGFMNLIPYLGSIAGVVIGCLVALSTGGNVIGVVIVFAVVQFIDNWFVQPIILSRSVRLHPLVIFLAVVFGGTYGGLLGMVLAVPLSGAFVVTVRTLREGLRPPVYSSASAG